METLSKLIPGGTKHQNNKHNPSRQLTDQSQQQKLNVFKVNTKETGTTSVMSLFLTLSLPLRIMVSLLLTLNICHILRDVKNAEIRALTDCKFKCFFFQI